MKRTGVGTMLIGALAVLAMLSMPVPTALSAGAQKAAEPEALPGELLVKFRPGVTAGQAQAVVQVQGAREVRAFKAPRRNPRADIGRWRHVKLGAGQDLKRVMKRLAEDPTVEMVEPNYVVRAVQTPDDPRFGELWGLHNTGQTGGAADADIDAPEAWDLHTGSPNVLVAVIDTGVAYDHPDLAANAWVNPGEIAGNGIDDDGNGYVDDVYGYDFYNNDANPYDDHGHGTHVAGTIAAVGNNGIGVVGVNWSARIMAVKFLGAAGSGSTTGAISAVLYATDMGARIMNNSWGGGGYSQALYDAIAAANQADALFVAAAGNSSNDNDLWANYPSNYDVPNVLAVAAISSADALADFSSYGATTVDLGAPGVSILSTVPTTGDACCSDPSGYKKLSGTSMATPHAVGAAALLLAQNPARTAVGTKALLVGTVDPLAALAGKTVAGGRLNLHSAMTCAPTQMTLVVKSPSDGFRFDKDQPATIAALVHSCGSPVLGAQVEAAFSDGHATVALYDDGMHGDDAANDGLYATAWIPTTVNELIITVTASDAAYGSVSQSISGQVRQRIAYTWTATDYAWIDVSGGTRYRMGNDSVVRIPIGFPFVFYGDTHTSVVISDNGLVGFTSPGWDSYLNNSIPSIYTPNNFVAPFWDDLDPAAGGAVYSLLEGEAPNRRLTVAWVDLPHDYWTGGAVSFEATLFEGSNEIVFQYQDVTFGSVLYDAGASASVGVENVDGTDGTQFLHNQPLLSDAMALKWRPIPYHRRPIASPGGPYQGYVNEPVVFDGTASSDPEGQPLSYRWNFGDGATGSGPTPSHVYAAKGTYWVSLVVNDGDFDSPPATAKVVIPNRAPVAVPGGPYVGRIGVPITFDGSGSYDPDGDAVTGYWWRFNNSSGSGVSPTYTFNWRGTYPVTLEVSDGTSYSSIVSTTVKVISPIPVANAGPDQDVASRAFVTLDGRGSYDEDGTIVSYAWRQISGKDVRLSGVDTATPTYTAPPFNGPCTIGYLQEFELTVTDNDGNTVTDTVQVTVFAKGCWGL